MDYTTLVERLLDGTITTAEHAELDRMRLSSPDIDREVRNLLEVEQILRQKGEEEDTRSLAFRESVRSTLKVSLGLSAGTTTDAQAPSAAVAAGTGAASSSLRLMLIALFVVSTGVGYFLISRTDSNEPPAPLPSVVVPPVEQPAEELPAPPAPAPQSRHSAPHVASADNTRETRETLQPEINNEHPVSADNTNTSPTEVEGTVDSPGSRNKQYSALIQKMLQQISEQEQTSRAAAAVTARQVALLYDKIGNTANARRYFDTARRYAQEASVKETEGEILGEYALFEARNGNKASAEDLAMEALRVLRTARSPQLPTWETSLKQLAK